MSNDKIVQLSPDKIKFSSVEDAIKSIQNGGFIIVADDEGRENEGDLICAASLVTPTMVNFMLKEARGMVCVALTKERAEALDLHPMVEENTDTNQTAFTISVDAGAEFGVTTGISASDRATTIQCLVSENATGDDFRRPGHVFPLIAKAGGVLRRVGHTEAAIDFTRLAGLPHAGVICEIMNDDGSMARRDDLAAFAKKHDIPFVTIAQLIEYRRARDTERFVIRKIVKEIDTKYGTFKAVGYKDTLNGVEHLALVKGSLEDLADSNPAVRVQHENTLLDFLNEGEDDSAQQMSAAMTYINAEGSGVVVYLRGKEGSANSLLGTLKSYGNSITKNSPRYRAVSNDLRDYGVGAQILADLGLTQFRMITNNPKKIVALRGFGLDITDTVQMPTGNFEFAPKAKAEMKSETKPMAKTEVKAETKSEPKVEAKAELKADTKFEPKNENVKQPELKAPPKQEMKMMRMGGQIISGQALFEG